MGRKQTSTTLEKPRDFDTSKDTSLLYLLIRGELPPSAFTENRFIHLRPAVAAVVYLQQLGQQAPHLASRVWQVAKEKYNGPEALKDKLQEVHDFKPDWPVLKTIRERLLLERLSDMTSRQVASGDYNPGELIALLEKSAGASDIPLQRLRKPNQRGEEKYAVKFGIPRLDSIVGGINNELVIVAAPPKNGKSNFFLNVAARQPVQTNVLYVTVEDYGFEEINDLLHVVNPKLFTSKENFHVADLTGVSATIYDIEALVKNISDGAPMLTIVDRAEKLYSSGKDDRSVFQEIFGGLRRIAKRYQTAVLTDSQYNANGQEATGEDGPIYSRHLYGDHTLRQSLMDMFVGIRRDEGSVALYLEGRRQGRLPADVSIPTSVLGVYQ